MAMKTMMCAAGGVMAGALVGMGAEYVLDPDRGRARRARIADQMRARARRMERTGVRRAHYARSLAQGKLQARRAMPAPPADDHELVQKVRSEVMGRADYRDLDVIIDANEGVVHLRGAVSDPMRAAALCDAVADVDGVRQVDSLLHAPGAPAPNKREAVRSSMTGRYATW